MIVAPRPLAQPGHGALLAPTPVSPGDGNVGDAWHFPRRGGVERVREQSYARRLFYLRRKTVFTAETTDKRETSVSRRAGGRLYHVDPRGCRHRGLQLGFGDTTAKGRSRAPIELGGRRDRHSRLRLWASGVSSLSPPGGGREFLSALDGSSYGNLTATEGGTSPKLA